MIKFIGKTILTVSLFLSACESVSSGLVAEREIKLKKDFVCQDMEIINDELYLSGNDISKNNILLNKFNLKTDKTEQINITAQNESLAFVSGSINQNGEFLLYGGEIYIESKNLDHSFLFKNNHLINKMKDEKIIDLFYFNRNIYKISTKENETYLSISSDSCKNWVDMNFFKIFRGVEPGFICIKNHMYGLIYENSLKKIDLSVLDYDIEKKSYVINSLPNYKGSFIKIDTISSSVCVVYRNNKKLIVKPIVNNKQIMKEVKLKINKNQQIEEIYFFNKTVILILSELKGMEVIYSVISSVNGGTSWSEDYTKLKCNRSVFYRNTLYGLNLDNQLVQIEY